MMFFRAIFLTVAALCGANALVIALNGAIVGESREVLIISLVVAAIYAAIGILTFFTQLYLIRVLRQTPSPDGALRRLAFCLALGASGIGLIMLLSLSAIAQRIGEGVAIFG